MKYYPILLTFLFSCGGDPSEESFEHKVENEFVQKIESAHQKSAFLEKDVIQFDIHLKFRGKDRLVGTLALTTDSEDGVIKETDGTELYYVKDQVYTHPEDSLSPDKIRFKAYTWSYFFLFPYKLSDPGTNWEDHSNKMLDGTEYDVQKLSFNAGVGDAPDDWYVTYSDKVSNLIYAAAYIVTYSKSQDEAEEDPHAITYEDYREVDGIPIAHEWNFWGWDEEGKLTDTLGSAVLSNFQFLKASEIDLNPPENFILIE